MKTITVDEIMALRPCYERSAVEKLAAGKTQGTAVDVLACEDLAWSDCLWLLRAGKLIDAKVWQLWAIDCATRALPLFEKRRPEDKRPRQALVAATSYLLGEITLAQLEKARSAAFDAAAAYAAYAAAYAAAAYAAYAADAAAAAAADAAAYADDAAAYARQERCWQRQRLSELVTQFEVAR